MVQSTAAADALLPDPTATQIPQSTQISQMKRKTEGPRSFSVSSESSEQSVFAVAAETGRRGSTHSLKPIMMNALDLRVYVYDRVLATGTLPISKEIAAHFGVPQQAVLDALRELKIGKTILPHPRTGEIWMAGPFSSAETPYKVIGQATKWWANCAWDMLGIAVLANEPVHIQASCCHCGESMTLDVDHRGPTADANAVVHFLVPASHWYDDIGFT